MNTPEKKRYIYRVTNVPLKHFGDIITYITYETTAVSADQAYSYILGRAKRDLGYTYQAKMSFDKKRIIKIREYRKE